MNAPNSEFAARCSEIFDYTPFPNVRKGLRGWWLSPPRPGIHRLIAPWEYRHLRFFGVLRIAGGSAEVIVGVVCLSYGAYGWAAFFLVLAALNLAGGGWLRSVARSASART